MDLILVAKESMPIYFESKNKSLDDINVAAFISAVKSFAKGSLQSDLISLKLGDLDIRLKEEQGFLYVLGMSVNTEIMPSEVHINGLVTDLGKLANGWLNTDNKNTIDVSNVPVAKFSETIQNFEKKVLKEAEQHKNDSNKIISTSIKDWNLLPLKTQESLTALLEHIILGDKIVVLDNNPNSPLIKDLGKLFRIPKELNKVLNQYSFEINLERTAPTIGIVFDPEANKITGKIEKNKYLKGYIDKIVHQQSDEHQQRLITLLTSTIGKVAVNLIDQEKDYATQQGKILNLLNNMHFEEVRLVLELLKRNRPSLHEKIVKLPIHKEWFNSW